MREGLWGEQEAAATQTHLHTYWAGVGQRANMTAIFACHTRVTVSKGTSAVSTLSSEWHLTEPHQTDRMTPTSRVPVSTKNKHSHVIGDLYNKNNYYSGAQLSPLMIGCILFIYSIHHICSCCAQEKWSWLLPTLARRLTFWGYGSRVVVFVGKDVPSLETSLVWLSWLFITRPLSIAQLETPRFPESIKEQVKAGFL